MHTNPLHPKTPRLGPNPAGAQKGPHRAQETNV
jgi:hypothetical protein